MSVRVLHVIDSLAGSGGAERGMARETVAFSDRLDQLLVTIHSRHGLTSEVEAGGVEVRTLGIGEQSIPVTWTQAHRRLDEVAGEFRPDVIHTSLYTGNAIGQSVAIRRSLPVLSSLVLSGDPSLLKAHQPGASSWKASAVRAVGGVLARRSQARFRALTVDAATTNAALLRVPVDRTTVIPRGVPAGPRTILSRRELGLPEDRPLIVNLGRLAAQKGQVHLVRAFGRVHAEQPEAFLVVIGSDGEAAPAVRAAIAEHGLEEHVWLVGYSNKAAHFLSHAQVFGFSSLMEGLGTAVLEALISGTPVVAFDIPPVREVTADGTVARLVEVGDEAALAEELLAGLDGRLDELGRSGQAHAEAHHSIEAVASKVEDLIVATASGD